METFKIDHFSKVHNGTPFPWHRPLTTDETEKIQRRLLNRLRLIAAEKNSLHSVCSLARIGDISYDLNVQDEDFDLLKVLENLGINPKHSVYINWYRFDQVDEMRLVDLVRYFDDIWYPSSDDIDIFDEDLSWVLSVTHDGDVRSIRFEQKRG